VNVRKNSSIAEDYQKDHYNIDYPDLEINHQIETSKTLNIVVVGHVDSGKSTLIGKLMYMIKEISNKEMRKN
jgi:elongation factor 1 alpha-like protein